jgi:predicted  nucleic acid-binding Zn-ribbon protein
MPLLSPIDTTRAVSFAKAAATPGYTVEQSNSQKSLASHLEHVAALSKSFYAISDEISALETEKSRLQESIDNPRLLQEVRTHSELKAALVKVREELDQLQDKKKASEKFLMQLMESLATYETKLGKKVNAISEVAHETQKIENQGVKLREDLARQLGQRQAINNKRKILQRALAESTQNITRVQDALNEKVAAEISLNDLLTRQPIEGFKKYLNLDLTYFDVRKKDETLLANTIATLNLKEEWQKVMTSPPGAGTAILAAMVAYASAKFTEEKDKAPSAEKVAGILVGTLIVTALLVFIKRGQDGQVLREQAHKLEVERRMPGKDTIEDDTISLLKPRQALGGTKGALDVLVHREGYQTSLRPELASIFLSTANQKIANIVINGLQPRIQEVLVQLLKAKVASSTTYLGEDESIQSIFDKHFNFELDTITTLLDAVKNEIKHQEETAKGGKKQLMTQLRVFLSNDKGHFPIFLHRLIREFTKDVFLKMSSDTSFREFIRNIESETENRDLLDNEINAVQASPSETGEKSDPGLLDFTQVRMASLLNTHKNLERQREQLEAEKQELLNSYKDGLSVCTTLDEEINKKISAFADINARCNEAGSHVDQARQSWQSKKAEYQQEIKVINKKIQNLVAQERQMRNAAVQNDNGVANIFTPAALKLVLDRHLGLTQNQLTEHMKKNGYAANFLTMGHLLEASVTALESFKTYAENNAEMSQPISYDNLYANCNKQIGKGMNRAGDSISTGAIYSIDRRTGKIAHIYPFIPMMSILDDERKAQG